MPVVHCISAAEREKFPFIKEHFPPAKPPASAFDCSTGLGALQGTWYDGILEIAQDNRQTDEVTLVRDDGAVYTLRSTDKERLYLGILNPRPTLFISKEQARDLIATIWGDAELSPPVRKTYCHSHACADDPITDPEFVQAQGDYANAERLYKAATHGLLIETARNNLAWFYATVKDPKFRQPKEAIAIMTQLIKAVEHRQDYGEADAQGRKIMVGAYHHTLAMAYYADGNYSAALATIDKVRGAWSPPEAESMRDMIRQKLPKRWWEVD